MAVYLVRGARNNILGNISDAGPFEVYLGTKDNATRAGTLSGFLVHDPSDNTDSKLENIVVDGVTFTNVVSTANLNAGIGLTISAASGNDTFIFQSVSNCTNSFTYIPPSPSPTPTVTRSATPSTTPTISVTPSVTPSVTATVTPTISVTPTITVSTSITPSVTVSVSTTPTITVTPSRTPSISVTPTISITPSISVTPGVSPTRTPSKTPPNSPPNSPSNSPSSTPPNSATPSITPSETPPVSPTRTPSISISPSSTPPITPSNSSIVRNSDTIFGVGSSTCDQACGSYSGTTVYFTDSSIGTSTTLYTSATGGTQIFPGFFSHFDGTDDCWRYAAGAYYIEECDSPSVIEGTMIATSLSSSVAVEDLEIGDTVMSKHIPGMPDSDDGHASLYSWEADNINGTQGNAIVVTNAPVVVRGIANFNNGALLATRGHHHLIKRDNIWRILRSAQIVVGDIFEDKNGNEVLITSKEVEDRDVTVYSLNVETDDVYYANGILTHNNN